MAHKGSGDTDLRSGGTARVEPERASEGQETRIDCEHKIREWRPMQDDAVDPYGYWELHCACCDVSLGSKTNIMPAVQLFRSLY